MGHCFLIREMAEKLLIYSHGLVVCAVHRLLGGDFLSSEHCCCVNMDITTMFVAVLNNVGEAKDMVALCTKLFKKISLMN